MRIVVVVNTFPSYSETFISNKVKGLSKNNKILVVCAEKNDQLFNDLFPDNKAVHVFSLTKKNILKKTLLNPFKTIFFLRNDIFKGRKKIFKKLRLNIINTFSPDIIHFEFSGVAIDYLDGIKDLKGRKVVSCRGSAEKVKLLTDIKRREKIQEIFKVIDAIHCVSQDMRKTILPFCIHPEKIFINYPSIETNLFKNKNNKLQNDVFIILSIGRLTFQKGYLTGLLTMKKLQKKNLNFKWLIIGEGEQREEIVFHTHQLELENNIELLGVKNSEEIISLYKMADIFFLPSVYEGIANAALEAMSMQLPVVSTRCGGMEEVITNNVNGFVCDVYDIDMLSDIIFQLSNNYYNKIDLGKKARETIMAKFSIEKNIDLFEKKYKALTTN